MKEIVLEDLRARIGEELAISDWSTVSQERIDRFAEATGDRQWLHVDVERAKRESPYGSPIAHGFLTLSLIGSMLRETISIRGILMIVNYGVNRVRFAAPVPAGATIRGRFTVRSVEPHRDATRVVWHVVVEREADGKTCCAGEWVVLYHSAK
jgi:acyl dehydratase